MLILEGVKAFLNNKIADCHKLRIINQTLNTKTHSDEFGGTHR